METEPYKTNGKRWLIDKDKIYDVLFDFYRQLHNEAKNSEFKSFFINNEPEKNKPMIMSPLVILESARERISCGVYYDDLCEPNKGKNEYCKENCEQQFFTYTPIPEIDLDKGKIKRKKSISELKKYKSFVISSQIKEKKDYLPEIDAIIDINVSENKPFAEIRLRNNKKVYINPIIIDSALEEYVSITQNSCNSMIDHLIYSGIPEEMIYKNKDLWETIQSVEKNEFHSKNETFRAKNRLGELIQIKFTRNRERAFYEAAANYYLSNTFDFILPGRFPKPVESNGVCMLLQKYCLGPFKPQRLDSWITRFAWFHRDTEDIFKENNIFLPEVVFRSARLEKERYMQIKKKIDFDFDEARLEDSIAFLEGSEHKTGIHNDVKSEHLIGKYLIDLELIGKGHPGVDLAMLLMIYQVPTLHWDKWLKKYLKTRGIKHSFKEEFEDLKEGVRKGAYFIVNREAIAATINLPEHYAKKNEDFANAWLRELSA